MVLAPQQEDDEFLHRLNPFWMDCNQALAYPDFASNSQCLKSLGYIFQIKQEQCGLNFLCIVLIYC